MRIPHCYYFRGRGAILSAITSLYRNTAFKLKYFNDNFNIVKVFFLTRYNLIFLPAGYSNPLNEKNNDNKRS